MTTIEARCRRCDIARAQQLLAEQRAKEGGAQQ